VYDTQCGAKVFRVNDAFCAALAEPFRSSWAFDVELLHRLLRGSPSTPGMPVTSFLEMPLETWFDVTGSKLRVTPALAALADLASIARDRVRSGRSRSGGDGAASVMVPRSSRSRDRSPGSPPGAGGGDTREERA
jgi:hypothetical protein